ncbi:MAG TPA: 4-hydroxy-tetrahydrodipicolinate reductase [Clostridiales bacterium]|nr:4-hydroxy-tetrahydrodipicolinate reductase [Clostridiales bacterium]
MINVLISGINGGTGKKVYELITKTDGFNLVCGVDKAIGGDFNCPVYKTFDEVKEMVDVAIDFSDPDELSHVLEFVKENGCALAEGTTGYTKAQMQQIKKLSESSPVFISHNLSLGTSMLFRLARIAATELKNFDIEIIEYRDREKQNAPGATTLSLARDILETLGEKNKIVSGRNGKRKPGEICLHSVRGGNLAGANEILFIGEDELIQIKHESFDNLLFARGAIKAARFIAKKTAGFYTMKDFSTAEE